MVNLIYKAYLESGMSKTQFAKELGIAKSFVIRVLNGEKPLSPAMFNKIIAMEGISIETKTAIKEVYQKNIFGSSQYEAVEHLIDLANGFEDFLNERYEVYMREEILEKILFGNQFNFCFRNEEELYEVISFFTKRCIEKQNSLFYTNFSFGQKQLSSLLFTLFRNRNFDNSLDFCRLVNMERNDAFGVLDTIFEAFKWSEARLNTFVSEQGASARSLIFPYYIITDEVVIIFSEDCKRAVAFNDKPTIDFYQKYFLEIKESYSPLLKFYSNELECYQEDFMKRDNIQCSINGALCVMQFTDHYILSRIANPTVNKIGKFKKEVLIQAVIQSFQIAFSKRPRQYLSKKALARFAEDGDLRLITKRYISPLPLNLRKRLFENMKEKAENIFVLREDKLSLYQQMDIHIYDKKAAISLYPTDSSSPYYDIYLDIPYEKSGALELLFKNTMKFLEHSEYYYDVDYFNNTMDEMIIKCTDEDEGKNEEKYSAAEVSKEEAAAVEAEVSSARAGE